MARLQYLSREDLPDEHRELFDVDEADPDDVILNVHRAMANNPRLLDAWSEWVWALYEEAGDARTRELVILAVARAVRCRYVWHQHVPIALEHGVSRGEIVGIADLDFATFPPAETALLTYTTTLVTGSIDDELHGELDRFFPAHEVVALLFLGSEYMQISWVIDAMAVDLEAEFVGWELEQLD